MGRPHGSVGSAVQDALTPHYIARLGNRMLKGGEWARVEWHMMTRLHLGPPGQTLLRVCETRAPRAVKSQQAQRCEEQSAGTPHGGH